MSAFCVDCLFIHVKRGGPPPPWTLSLPTLEVRFISTSWAGGTLPIKEIVGVSKGVANKIPTSRSSSCQLSLFQRDSPTFLRAVPPKI